MNYDTCPILNQPEAVADRGRKAQIFYFPFLFYHLFRPSLVAPKLHGFNNSKIFLATSYPQQPHEEVWENAVDSRSNSKLYFWTKSASWTEFEISETQLEKKSLKPAPGLILNLSTTRCQSPFQQLEYLTRNRLSYYPVNLCLKC